MKIFTFTKLGRTLLMLTAVLAAAVLLGCGGDNGAGGGSGVSRDGNLVGDWRFDFESNKGVMHNRDYIDIESFKSSGDYVQIVFSKLNDTVWGEYPDGCGHVFPCSWRTDGSLLYTSLDGTEVPIPAYYNISGDTLKVSLDSSFSIGVVNWIKTDLADFRKSLGL